MTLTRRGFFGSIIAAFAARLAPTVEWVQNTTGIPCIGGIDVATYKFWRNQSVDCPMNEAELGRAYDECARSYETYKTSYIERMNASVFDNYNG